VTASRFCGVRIPISEFSLFPVTK